MMVLTSALLRSFPQNLQVLRLSAVVLIVVLFLDYRQHTQITKP